MSLPGTPLWLRLRVRQQQHRPRCPQRPTVPRRLQGGRGQSRGGRSSRCVSRSVHRQSVPAWPGVAFSVQGDLLNFDCSTVCQITLYLLHFHASGHPSSHRHALMLRRADLFPLPRLRRRHELLRRQRRWGKRRVLLCAAAPEVAHGHVGAGEVRAQALHRHQVRIAMDQVKNWMRTNPN